jgi:hypothetical protein
MMGKIHGAGGPRGVPGGGGGGGDGASFTLDGLSKEYFAGDILTMEDAQKIVDASGGQLYIEDGVIKGTNPDGSGDVYIVIGQPLDEGQIHDLHHTVPGSGGKGNSNDHKH